MKLKQFFSSRLKNKLMQTYKSAAPSSFVRGAPARRTKLQLLALQDQIHRQHRPPSPNLEAIARLKSMVRLVILATNFI